MTPFVKISQILIKLSGGNDCKPNSRLTLRNFRKPQNDYNPVNLLLK